MTNMLNMDRDVAIYARVSTEHEEQLSALENQTVLRVCSIRF
jgi:predicted site-specific integrase-resolvase